MTADLPVWRRLSGSVFLIALIAALRLAGQRAGLGGSPRSWCSWC
jgi:hypothetical protein